MVIRTKHLDRMTTKERCEYPQGGEWDGPIMY